ncbi:hypothetical protein GCM10009647_075530 [Streptomyces sanglieri]
MGDSIGELLEALVGLFYLPPVLVAVGDIEMCDSDVFPVIVGELCCSHEKPASLFGRVARIFELEYVSFVR